MQDARLKDMSWIDFSLNKATRDIIQIITNTGAVDLEHFDIPGHQIVLSCYWDLAQWSKISKT